MGKKSGYYNDYWMDYEFAPPIPVKGGIKARSQSLGETRSVGLMQRPERLILLIAGSLVNAPVGHYFPAFGDGILIVVLALLAVSSNITALRRLHQGKKDLK